MLLGKPCVDEVVLQRELSGGRNRRFRWSVARKLIVEHPSWVSWMQIQRAGEDISLADWLLIDLNLNSFLQQPALFPLFSSSPTPQALQTLRK